jgi:uncharacterized protein (DUF1501 family)
MRALFTTALLAGLAGPALALDASAEAAGHAFLARCTAEGARAPLCLCVLDRVAASAPEPAVLEEALGSSLARLVRHSDPRLAEALVSGVAECGGRLVLRAAREG